MWRYAILFIGAMAMSADSVGQMLRYRTYTPTDGIHYPFIYSLNRDQFGNLVIGTGEGLYVFNGRNFRLLNEKNGLAGDFIRTSFQSSSGDIWLGHSAGAVTRYDGKNLQAFDLSLFTKSRIRQMVEDDKKNIWIVTQNDGLIRITPEGKTKAFYKDFKDVLCFSAAVLPNGEILLGHDSGIWRLREKGPDDDTFIIREVELPFLSAVVNMSGYAKEKLVFYAEDEGLWELKLTEGDRIETQPLPVEGTDGWKIENIVHRKDGTLWLCTHKMSLVRLKKSNGTYKRPEFFGLNNRMPESVQTVLEDEERILWIGTYGKGLIKVVDSYLSFTELRHESETAEVHAIAEHGKSLWVGTNRGLVVYPEKGIDRARVLGPELRLPRDTVTSIVFDANETVRVSTGRSGIFKASLTDTVFRPLAYAPDRLSRQVRQMVGHKNRVYAATAAGLFVFDTDTDQFEHFTIRDGLAHNALRAVAISSDESVWVASEGSGMNVRTKGEFRLVQFTGLDRNSSISSIAAHRNGHIALAGEGSGLHLISGLDTLRWTQENGLLSNYCRAVAFDPAGRLWVTHYGGVSMVTPSDRSVRVFAETGGLSERFMNRSIYAGSDGVVWMGAEGGMLRYDKAKDVINTVEPYIVIEGVSVGEFQFKSYDNVSVGYGNYKVRIDFTGVSHKNPERVTYTHFLEGHDLDWSERGTTPFVQYGNLGPGTYLFKLKAFNSDGVGGETETIVRITVGKPYWSKPWFIVLCIMAFLAVIYLILKQRERLLLERQRELKRQLDEKTHELRDQKDLLEIRNKDITDSITYAKNIQKALLPPKGKLNEWLPDSFVFYKPRDIVSGDFFWLEEFNDRLIIACADCTGHGVPGAIMSVLGFGLLREISRNPNVQTTDEALNLLDKELRMVLGRYAGANSISDGMDMALLDIHLKTGVLNFSSARRPVVIFRKGEMLIFKGDRLSIGGRLDEEEKSFQEHAVKLMDGDTVFVFSDGIVDQFGGPDGKKLKTKGFLDFLQSIQIHDMEVQKTLLRSFFVKWKGVLPQVDDILVIAFRW